MTIRATWNGGVIAESDNTILVEGNHYFPPQHVHPAYLEPSDTTSHCTWKGDAAYRHIVVDGSRLDDAAWYYPDPYEPAHRIAHYVAFWKDIEVTGMNPEESEIAPPPQTV